MTPPPPPESPCQMMARLAQEQAAGIGGTEERVGELRTRITGLEAQPDPAGAQIGALRQALETLEKKVVDDRAALAALEDVIRENC
ncbi:hypothetical protein [Streptomyces sp. adm13(2018)]|uniref:hypothetical protein n=1 Tax=Streptomyces sp. adm13(2018) TaxID=2479007 RepID=UPI00164F8CDF|nr:hypothetical protein [Streptomyces sp. adm13(2018)]